MPVYDNQNILAKILRGEIPCHKVYEDSHALAIMDIFPQAPGHVLVIPRAESRNLLDADPAVIAAVMPTVQKLAQAIKATTRADGIRIAQFNEAPAGQTIFHLHFHIIPSYAEQDHAPHASKPANDTELAVLAREIAAAIK